MEKAHVSHQEIFALILRQFDEENWPAFLVERWSIEHTKGYMN